MSKRLHRRHFLRGVMGGAGIGVALPALEIMLGSGRALAQAARPRRLVTFFWGNGRGIDAARWTPAATGSAWTPSPQLTPLAGLKDQVTIVSGFDSKLTRSPRGHHNGCVTMLSGGDYQEQPANGAPFRSTFALPSIDQVVARELGKATPFRSLEIAISSKVIRGEGSTLAFPSHNGPDSGNPPEVSPAALYGRLFAMGSAPSATDGLAQVTLELRKSALDAVLADLNGLTARVGARDRARLDQHAQNIRDIEKRLAEPGLAASCSRPATMADPTGASGREPLEERMQVMSRLLATAFACDLTRVASILFNGSVASTVFWQVGATRGHHDLSHEGQAAQTVIDASTTFVMKQFATLLDTLARTPDGDGNLLDQCALLATSDCSNGAAHSTRDMPIVLAGKAGGALRAGIHHRAAPGSDNNTSRVLLSVVRAVGVNVASLGAGGGQVTTGLAEITQGG
jgi:hypothetical protein